MPLHERLHEVAERAKDGNCRAEPCHLGQGHIEDIAEPRHRRNRADETAKEALDRLVRADCRGELVRAKSTPGKVGKAVARPCADEHDPDHRRAEAECFDWCHIRPARKIAQHDEMCEWQSDVRDAGHGDTNIGHGHIPAQNHGCQECEHCRRRHRKQDNIELSEISAVEHTTNAEQPREERWIAPAMREGTRKLEPCEHGKNRTRNGKRRTALLNHIRSKDNTNRSRNNACNQRLPPIYSSASSPPKRRLRPAKSSIARASSFGVKSGQCVSVK